MHIEVLQSDTLLEAGMSWSALFCALLSQRILNLRSPKDWQRQISENHDSRCELLSCIVLRLLGLAAKVVAFEPWWQLSFLCCDNCLSD